MRKLLEDWKAQPKYTALAYARAGFHRGEPGRALAGFAQAGSSYYGDLVKWIESLLALDKRDEALMCWSHHKRIKMAYTPLAQVAAARVYLANQRPTAALPILAVAPLRSPRRRLDSEVNRLLRVAASFGPEPFVQTAAAFEKVGATRLASAARRDGADFAPGFPGAASGHPVHFAVDALATLRSRLERDGLAPIDELFGQLRGDNQAVADELVKRWTDVVGFPNRDEEQSAFAGRLAYLFANAACRYFALTTQAPNVLAGALRTVSQECLELMCHSGVTYDDATLRGLFEALEKHANCDQWLFDTWLLRLERALDLDRFRGGHLGPLVQGLPRIAHYLRGDELIAAELRQATSLAADPAKAGHATDLFERCFRAIGGNAILPLAKHVESSRDSNATANAMWLAYHCHPFNAYPAVSLAKILWQAGHHDACLGVLCERLGWAGRDWRVEQLGKLSAEIGQRFAVPWDFNAAQQKALQALNHGNAADALRLFRWCDALDPGNAAVLQNLGLAYIKLGAAEEALACFGELDSEAGCGNRGAATACCASV